MSLAACGADAQRGELLKDLGAQGEVGQPVAEVNGRPIPEGPFARLVARSERGLSRDQLLDEVIVGELLYEEAVQAGYADGPEAELTRRRLMVQALLRDQVERAVPPEAIPAEEVRAFYQANLNGYQTPELRSVDHLLVQFDPARYDVRSHPEGPPEALRRSAHAFAEQLKADLDQRGFTSVNVVELNRLAEAWQGRTPEGLVLKVESDILTPLREYGVPGQPNYFPAVVPPFAAATFAAARGVPSAPVDTIFGTHILVVTRIIPAQVTPLEEVTEPIRQHLLAERRKVVASELIARLMEQASVQLDPQAPERLEQEASGAP